MWINGFCNKWRVRMLKKFTRSKAIKIIWLVYALFSIGLILFLANRTICRDYDEVSKKTILDKGWSVSVNDDSWEDIDLTKFEFPDLTIGDKIVLVTQIPTEWDYKLPGLTMYIRQVAIRVMVDEEVIHEYGYDRIIKNESVGCGYQFIDFSEQYKGKEMTIQMEVSEHKAFRSINPLYISESKNALRQIAVDNRLPLISGSFFVVLGVVISFVSIFAVLVSRKYMKIVFLAAFSICIGIWTLCYYDLMTLFALPVYTASLLEYMTLFLMPIPITAYMFWHAKALKSKVIMIMYKGLFLMQVTFSVIVITLHAMNIVHGAASLPYFQAFLIVWSLFSVYVLQRNLRMNTSHTKVFFVGFMLVIICVMLDLLNYGSGRYAGSSLFNFRGASSVGILIFLIIILFDLYCDVVKHMIEDKEKKMLIDRAYTDDLTGLHNHRYCAEYMDKLEKEGKRNYAIVSVDLNNLKKINDEYGHLKGDELIRNAADILEEAFAQKGVVGRLGGDEFIVIMSKCSEADVKKYIAGFEDRIKEINLSLAFGYAMASEIEDNNVDKVYQLADERMYKEKRRMKSENK